MLDEYGQISKRNANGYNNMKKKEVHRASKREGER